MAVEDLTFRKPEGWPGLHFGRQLGRSRSYVGPLFGPQKDAAPLEEFRGLPIAPAKKLLVLRRVQLM